MLKFLTAVLLIFISKDRGGLLNCSIRVFSARINAKLLKIQTFSLKKWPFQNTRFKFAGSRHFKTAVIFFLSSEKN